MSGSGSPESPESRQFHHSLGPVWSGQSSGRHSVGQILRQSFHFVGNSALRVNFDLATHFWSLRMSYIPSRGYRDNWRTQGDEEEAEAEEVEVTTKIHRHRSVHSTTARLGGNILLKYVFWAENLFKNEKLQFYRIKIWPLPVPGRWSTCAGTREASGGGRSMGLTWCTRGYTWGTRPPPSAPGGSSLPIF